jgi:hypothetical protein
MKWVIHEAVRQMKEWGRFVSEVENFGHKVQVYGDLSNPPDGDFVRCPVYHSIKYNSHRGVFCNLDELDAYNFYSRLPYSSLGRHFECGKMKDVKSKLNELRMEGVSLCQALGLALTTEPLWKIPSDNFFIKASKFGKRAGSHVISHDTISYYTDKYKVDEDEMMLVAAPVNFTSEYRVIVKEDKPLVACQYKSHGKMDEQELKPDKEDSILNWVYENVINHYTPKCKLYVIDIGLIDGSIMSVVEMNSFSSSGFYNCNITRLLKGIDK